MLLKVIGTILSKVFTTGIGFLIVIITSKELGSSARGEIALMLLNISIIGLIQGIFNGSSLIYLTPRYSFLKLTLFANAFSMLSSFIITSFLWWIELVEDHHYFFLLMLSLVQGLLTSSQSLLLGKEKISHFNYLEIFKSITLIGSLLLFFYYSGNRSLETTFYAYLISYSLPFFVSIFWLFPLSLKATKQETSTSLIRDFFQYGFQIQLNNISQMINYRFCFFLIEKLKGKAQLGIFSVAISLSEAIWIVCKSIATFQYSKLVNTPDIMEKKRITILCLHLSFFATIPLIALVILLPNSFFAFLFGTDFDQLRPILISLSFAVLCLSYFTIINHYFTATGLNKLNIFGSIIGNSVTIITCILLIPALGTIGAGIATSISYLGMLVYLVNQFKKRSNSNYIELIPSLKSIQTILRYQTN